ncbi:MAG: hypothetical protein JSS27_11610 [Planctomycetes bacterium]|nr:hypothetical protein [Planctomycetota bacterium]
MKKGFLCAAMTLGMLIAGLSLQAQDYQVTANYDDTNAATPSYADQVATDSPAGTPCCGNCGNCDQCCGQSRGMGCGVRGRCNQCFGAGCGQCCGSSVPGLANRFPGLFSHNPPTADPCPKICMYAQSGYDMWRGPSEGSATGNQGGNTGLNVGIPLLAEHGIAGQVGATYGLYNWSGSPTAAGGPPPSTTNQQIQQQLFVTYGFFRRADTCRPIAWGVVQDWMNTNNFGQFGDSFTMSQIRAQIGYNLDDRNEVGLWGTAALMGGGSSINLTSYRPVQQYNLFYHRKFARGGGDCWFYAGIPETWRLSNNTSGVAPFPQGTTGGSLGSVIYGFNTLVPLNDRLAIYGNWAYMAPSGGSSAVTSRDEVWNLQLGLVFYPGNAARSTTVAGRKFMPYMPIANNGTMMTDTNIIR